jgi:hypothetical protein
MGRGCERYADTLIAAELRQALLVLLIATGMVLLIGCAISPIWR